MLLLTPLYIRFLGVESYGLIGFYFSWIAIVGILDTGISAAAVREFAWLSARSLEKKKIPDLLRSLEIIYWGIILIVGLGILTGSWFFGKDWFQTKDLSPQLIQHTLMLMSVSLVAQIPSGLYVSGLMGLQRQVECSGLLAVFGTLRGFGAVLVLWLIRPDIRLFFLWQIVICALQTGVIRWWLWRKIDFDRRPAKFSLGILHSVKAFAGGMILITTLSIIITQIDKMILSRVVSLEVFGFYMLAWAVASSLTRVATPLIQAFSPRFTELISKGDDEALAKHVHLASQLMSALVLPPAALIMFFAKPILFLWTGNQAVAAGASPILTVMLVGTALSISAYPALSVLYSKKYLYPVIMTCFISLSVLLPLLVFAIARAGAIGAALCWGVYGLIIYIVYQIYGLQGIPKTGFFLSTFQDFFAPCASAFAVVAVGKYFLNSAGETLIFILLLGLILIAGWLAALLACKDLNRIVMDKLKWVI